MMKQVVHIIKVIIIVGVLLVGGQYLYAFGPTCAPPDCNSDAPINASSTDQIKTGGLTIGKNMFIQGATWVTGLDPQDNVTPLQIGLVVQNGQVLLGTTTPVANASSTMRLVVNGGAGASEFCDPSGVNCIPWDALYDSVYSPGGFNCSSVPTFTTLYNKETGYYFNQPVFGESGYYGASSARGWQKVSMPAACSEPDGCIIRTKIYKRYSVPGWTCNNSGCTGWYEDKLYKITDTEYRQEAGSGAQLWWSAFSTSGKLKNGDTTSSNITSGAGSIESGAYNLRDDRNATLSADDELSNAQWSPFDSTRSYGAEVFVCTNS
ncbi:MAG: hypothetical protein RL094_164 [Candidatus Parcubacteria bacterium]|jgi:hypothetical protein